MAGLSSRFFEAGYEKPKYMLEAHGKTLFDYAVSSFSRYFDTEIFIFIVRGDFEATKFVDEHAKLLNIKKYQIVVLDYDTRGQADTVYLALKKLGYVSGAVTIFNIDTYRPGFKHPDFLESCDGYLEVFKGDGEHWSFAKPINTEESNLIEKTAEKKRISDLCSTGLYYFSNISDFMSAFHEAASQPKEEWPKGELYIAPMYNTLIDKGKKIKYSLVTREDVVFFGTPDEYSCFMDIS
ncbi:glycosyltransferase family 2 protein [Halomonas ventosae]|nr:glycosyltransferase family 2 protein [Halomonas ventosae]